MSLPQIPIETFIDLKANGEASRMRNHRGNMPSLPQNKCCALCPAKFTRTTHLNRHLRSHTNERAHRCSNCNADFTRSDLLTRHKRSCGDASANKSRRKSCQACAESKVKCNLEQPCSKCSAKGKECIFINDPGTSRHKKGLAKGRLPSSASPSEEEVSECSLGLENLSSSRPSSTISHISYDVDNIPHHIIPPYHPCPQFLSPQLNSVDSRHNSPNAFHTMELDSDLFPNVPDPYVEDSFEFSSSAPLVQSEPDASPWSVFNQTRPASGPHVYSQPLQGDNHDQSFVSGLTNLTPSSFSKSAYSKQPSRSYYPVNLGAPISGSSASGNPTTEELNQYCTWLLFQPRRPCTG